MTSILSHIALDSGKHPQYSIIWLHGLGADGHDFVPIVDELRLPVAVRYIFPHAPKRPVTINGGFIMRAWYDIASENIDMRQDEPGIRASQADVGKLIEKEVARGMAPEHIFLAGFSQGGAIALQIALRQNLPLAGVLALSTYLPLSQRLKQKPQPVPGKRPSSWRTGATTPSYRSQLERPRQSICVAWVIRWNGMTTPCSTPSTSANCATSRLG